MLGAVSTQSNHVILKEKQQLIYSLHNILSTSIMDSTVENNKFLSPVKLA